MLREETIQWIEGNWPRRWMWDEYLDRIVWYEPERIVYGFQLRYDKAGRGRAIRWQRRGKFAHHRVDSGEEFPTANRAPVIAEADESCAYALVRREFQRRSAEIDPESTGSS